MNLSRVWCKNWTNDGKGFVLLPNQYKLLTFF
jgi:hypothetical protein